MTFKKKMVLQISNKIQIKTIMKLSLTNKTSNRQRRKWKKILNKNKIFNKQIKTIIMQQKLVQKIKQTIKEMKDLKCKLRVVIVMP